MLSEDEIIKQRERNEKKKKILFIAVGVVVGLIVLLGIVSFILSAINDHLENRAKTEIENETRRTYIYPPADYDYDIFSDAGYLGLDRGIWFSDGVAKTVVTDDNLKQYSPEVQFMYNVINMIIKGDYVEYNKIFTANYMRTAGDDIRERFTMQQLFDIELEYVYYDESGSEIYSDIVVTYWIRNNNGTFRNDLDYNDAGALPVVYRLISNSEGIKVNDLLSYYKYTSGLWN